MNSIGFMKNKLIFYTGILGVSLFAISSIAGGLLIEGYSVQRQYISESYAIDTDYGLVLRSFGFIPSGVLIAIFCFSAHRYFLSSQLTKIGFYGMGIFYGIATVVVGLFPCDSGCNKEFIDPSISQLIHNLAGSLTYLFVPASMILIGVGLNQFRPYKRLIMTIIICAIISILFIWVLFSNPNSQYLGVYQRIVEIMFIIVIIACAIEIRRNPV